MLDQMKVTSIPSSVRLHRQVHEQVQEWALKESRTISNMLAVLVKEALKNRGAVLTGEKEE